MCHGEIECRGGGDKACAQRNPRPSVLAGIIDTYGGIRYVIEHRSGLRHHKRHDELLVVVPRLKVHEPIAWNDIPIVVERIALTVREWIAQGRYGNEPWAVEAVRMYQLRQLEHTQRSLDLHAIAET